MTIKRLNYFTGQFLEAADFKAEQDYHIDMRRRGNSALYYSAGILDGGFVVTQAPGDPTKITISPGIGIDTQGRELVITEAMTVSLPLPTTTQEVFVVTLSYKPEPTDFKTVEDTVTTDGVTTTISLNDATRLKEEADVEVGKTVPADAIVIAKITIDTTGKLIGPIDASMRPLADARFPHNVVVGQGGKGVLKTRYIDGKKEVPGSTADDNDNLYLNWNTGKDVYLGFGGGTQSSLHVSGIATIGSNPVRFTSGWSGFSDSGTNKAEISNDTSVYKSLMIAGNRSANSNVRLVSVWDRLEVHGVLHTTGEIQTTSPSAFRMVCDKFGSFFRNDGSDTYLLLTNSGNPYGGWNDLRPLRINNSTGAVTLSNLNVADNFAASIGCADFRIGYSGRRGSPGRALVDYKDAQQDALHVNYGPDWKNVVINGNVGVGTTDPKARLDIEGTALLGYETSISDFGASLKSGFYQNGGQKIPGDVPDFSSAWTHLITARHNNPANNHQLQIAASYADNDRLYFRKIAVEGTAWKEVATRDTNVFTGEQTIEKTLTVGSNPIHFTSGWSGFPDGETSVAEISNDTSNYKTLMIVGNKSAGLGRRVSVWDRLEVNGVLHTTGEIQTTSPNAFRMVCGDYGSIFSNDGVDTRLLLTEAKKQYGDSNRLSPLSIDNATGDVFITSLDARHLNVTGKYLTVKGLGNEQAYIGGDANENDVQVGSLNSTITSISFWNDANKDYMNIHFKGMTNHSDKRAKKNITRLTGALDCVMKLRGVSFDWKKETSEGNGRKNIGFIAQEVEKVLPEVVSQSCRGSYGVNYTAVIPVLVEAIKEQQKEIEKLKQARTKGA